jgi:molybdate transport system substrate-binding protein
VLSFAGSSSLRAQILDGAPADVFASASSTDMDAVTDRSEVFATNTLQVVVPADNPGDVAGLADLADPGLLVGLCAPQVPCGRLSRAALAAAGVEVAPDTEEPDVRSLLTKVAAGELDAGVVYRTDVLAAGEAVRGIDLPIGIDATAEYPIAALDPRGDAFVAFVLGDEGRAILAAHGFGPP